MSIHRKVRWGTALFVGLLLVSGVLNGQENQSAPFYYYQGDSIKLVTAPDLMSGVLADDSDTTWLASQAMMNGLAKLRVGTRDFRRGFFLVRLEGGVPAARMAYYRALASSGRLRALYAGFRTRDSSVVILTGDLVGRFKPDVTRAQIDSFAVTMGVEIASFTDKPRYRRYVFRTTGVQQDPIMIANRLQESGLVEYATPDFITDRRPHGIPNDSFFVDQFHLRNPVVVNGVPVDIGAVAAWDWSLGSAIKIAIIDSGLECGHDEFAGRVLTGFDAFAADTGHTVCSPDHAFVNNAHGTLVAGLALGNHGQGKIAGVAPSASIIPVRIFAFERFGDAYVGDAGAATAIRWAWETAGADILNNSWGGGAPNADLTAAIRDAYVGGRDGKGSVVIFGAGNNPTPQPEYPATVFGAFSVSGINRRGNQSRYARRAAVVAPTDSAQRAAQGDSGLVSADFLGARGRNSDCTSCGADYGDAAYSRHFGGTSGAVPQVSGIAALMLQLHPQFAAGDVYNTISGTADDWFTTGYDTLSGWGKVNAYKATRKAGPVLDVTVWGSEGYVTTKTFVYVFDESQWWWSYSDHVHSWSQDGSPRGSLGGMSPTAFDTSGFQTYLGEDYTTVWQADVTEQWKSGSGNTTITVCTAQNCSPPPIPIVAAQSSSAPAPQTAGAAPSGPVLYGAGPVVVPSSGSPSAAQFYSLGSRARLVVLPGSRAPSPSAAIANHVAASFASGSDTLLLSPLASEPGQARVMRFALRGKASSATTRLAFAFDPDVGTPANDLLTWRADPAMAIVGDSIDGFWGVRLIPTGQWTQSVVQFGSQAAGRDPFTPDEVAAAIATKSGTTATGPSDVRFLIAAMRAAPSAGYVEGYVATASAPTVEGVAALLSAVNPATVAVVAPGSQVAPTSFAFEQLPPMRLNAGWHRVGLVPGLGTQAGVTGTSASSVESGPSVLAAVRSEGIRGVRVAVPQTVSEVDVHIRIYDLRGSLVRDAVHEKAEPGLYSFIWDGHDQAGRDVAPGVYIVVLRAGAFSARQRLIIPR